MQLFFLSVTGWCHYDHRSECVYVQQFVIITDLQFVSKGSVYTADFENLHILVCRHYSCTINQQKTDFFDTFLNTWCPPSFIEVTKKMKKKKSRKKMPKTDNWRAVQLHRWLKDACIHIQQSKQCTTNGMPRLAYTRLVSIFADFFFF